MEKGYGERKNEKVVIQRQQASSNMSGENAGILLQNNDEDADEEDEENAEEEDEEKAEEDEENVDETEGLKEQSKHTLSQPPTLTGWLVVIYRPSSPMTTRSLILQVTSLDRDSVSNSERVLNWNTCETTKNNFSDASSHLYMSVCPSVRWSVGPSVPV